MAVLTGSTHKGQEVVKAQQAVEAPFLPAAYWRKGRKLAFQVLSTGKNGNGNFAAVRLVSPDSIELDGRKHSVIRIGNLAGIWLAVTGILEGQPRKPKYFREKDKVALICSGLKAPEKEGNSPMPEFDLELEADDLVAPEESGAA